MLYHSALDISKSGLRCSAPSDSEDFNKEMKRRSLIIRLVDTTFFLHYKYIIPRGIKTSSISIKMS